MRQALIFLYFNRLANHRNLITKHRMPHHGFRFDALLIQF